MSRGSLVLGIGIGFGLGYAKAMHDSDAIRAEISNFTEAFKGVIRDMTADKDANADKSDNVVDITGDEINDKETPEGVTT